MHRQRALSDSDPSAALLRVHARDAQVYRVVGPLREAHLTFATGAVPGNKGRTHNENHRPRDSTTWIQTRRYFACRKCPNYINMSKALLPFLRLEGLDLLRFSMSILCQFDVLLIVGALTSLQELLPCFGLTTSGGFVVVIGLTASTSASPTPTPTSTSCQVLCFFVCFRTTKK